MSISIEWNPPGIVEGYLAGLDTCFPYWGDATTYDWCFHRDVGDGAADLIVVREDGTLLAGSGVTYRRVVLSRGGTLRVAIMTGSWTLPSARGKGCFTRVVEESVRAAARRDAAVLIAFVTETNPSYRRLAAAGAGLVPSWHVSSMPSTPPLPRAIPLNEAAVTGEVVRALVSDHAAGGATRSRFAYPAEDVWAGQFLRRSNPTRVLQSGGDVAVVEEAPLADRIQLISGDRVLPSLLARAQGRSRQLFYFTTRPELRDAGTRLGLAANPSYLTLLVTDPIRLQQALEIDTAWTAADSAPLGDPESPWYLGPWAIQSGDRM